MRFASKVLKAVFGIAALGIAASAHAQGGKEVVLATWGGSWGKAIKEQTADPFEKATGNRVKMIAGVSLANMQLIASQKANPQVDVIMMTAQDAVRAQAEGLLAPLNVTEIPNLKESMELGLRKDASGVPFAAGMWMYPYGILHRTDQVKFDVNKWSDLWDKRLENKVAVSSPKYMSAYFLLMINRLQGGKEPNVDPGFTRIKGMGKNLLAVADDSASQQRLLAQGEVWAVPMLSGTAHATIGQGVPAKFVIPSDGAPVGVDVIALVKGGPNAATAKQFVNHYIGAETLARVTETLKVTPLNNNSKISAEHAKFAVAKEDLARLVSFDDRVINANREGWLERWQREIAPMTSR